MADERHVKGLADLQKFMDQLTPKMERNVMRGAMRAGMNVIKPIAQANVHSVSGELARGLRVATRVRGGTVTSRLVQRGKHWYIGKYVEYGTKAHLISVQESEKPINTRRGLHHGLTVSMTTINRLALRIGRVFVGPKIHHPGATPKPYMRPALDSGATAAVVAVGEYIKKRLATKEGLDTADVVIEGDD